MGQTDIQTDRRARDDESRQQKQPPEAGNQDEGHESQDATMRETETAKTKSRLAAFGAEGREAKQDSQAADGWRGIGRFSATRSATMQLHVRYGHTHSTKVLDGVWSVGCVSHRLGVVARSKSDGAVAMPSTRGLAGIHRQQDSRASSVVGGTDQGGSRAV